MARGSDLPKRRSNGYTVTMILLQVMAGQSLADQINAAVKLPPVPKSNLNELQLAELLRRLAPYASEAREVLERFESETERTQYIQPRYERVEIRVLSGGRLLGRVNGAHQTFNERGRMTSAGIVAHLNANPPRRGQGKK
jgi:hypothetical protein